VKCTLAYYTLLLFIVHHFFRFSFVFSLYYTLLHLTYRITPCFYRFLQTTLLNWTILCYFIISVSRVNYLHSLWVFMNVKDLPFSSTQHWSRKRYIIVYRFDLQFGENMLWLGLMMIRFIGILSTYAAVWATYKGIMYSDNRQSIPVIDFVAHKSIS